MHAWSSLNDSLKQASDNTAACGPRRTRTTTREPERPETAPRPYFGTDFVDNERYLHILRVPGKTKHEAVFIETEREVIMGKFISLKTAIPGPKSIELAKRKAKVVAARCAMPSRLPDR